VTRAEAGCGWERRPQAVVDQRSTGGGSQAAGRREGAHARFRCGKGAKSGIGSAGVAQISSTQLKEFWACENTRSRF
jgi:hypothetical protein